MNKATFVLYYATDEGYRVIAYDDDVQPVEEYTAGNHPGDSQARLLASDSMRVKYRQLVKWARQTALETADKYGIPHAKVQYDSDGEESERVDRSVAR